LSPPASGGLCVVHSEVINSMGRYVKTFWFLLLSLCAVSAVAEVYYVSPTGDDAASGLTVDSAWASIDNGCQTEVLVPGDTVNIMAGTHLVTSDVHLDIAGTGDLPIVYRGYGDSTTIINGNDSSAKLLMLEAEHINIQNLELTNSREKAIEVKSDSCIVIDCYIHHVGHEAVRVTSDYNLFIRNIIAFNLEEGFKNEGGAHENLYYNNTVYSNGKMGFQLKEKDSRVFNNISVLNEKGINGDNDNICAFNNVWNNSSGDYSNGVIDSAGGISEDPLFVDASGGDFSLLGGSPCIDAGLDLGYSFLGAAPDMGAIESSPVTVSGTVYWVSPSGNDDNDGLDSTTAWVSIDNGDVKGLLTPGDTVNILPGTYSVSSTVQLNLSGTALYPIVHRGFGTGEVIIDIGGASEAIFDILGNYRHIISLTMTNSQRDAIQLYGDACYVYNCIAHDYGYQGIDVHGSDNLIQRNIFHNAGQSGIVNRAGAENNRFYGNTAYSCDLDGVWIDGSVSTARVFNNILVQGEYGIRGPAGNVCAFNNVCNNTSFDYTDGVSDSAGGISEDPLFEDPAADNFVLQDGSPCIDAGLDLGYPFYGSAPDMGAIEFEPSDTNQSPELALIGAKSLDEGTNLNFGVSATDSESIPSLSVSSLPSGAAFDDYGDGTGTFDWTPTYDQSGVYSVTFYATDDSAAVDSEVVAITVNNVNRAPVLAPIGPKLVDEGQSLTFGSSATDADSTTPSLSAVPIPTNASFTDNGDGTGTFEFDPNYTQANIYNVKFIASDGSLADTEIVSITVINVNRAPVLDPIGAKSVDEGQNLNYDISASDSDGTTPVLTAEDVPANATFDDHEDGTGTINFDPDFTQAGIYNVRFIASDGGLADSELVAITVDDINQPPVLDPIGNHNVPEGDTLSLVITASDPDSTTPSLSAVDLPANASLVDSGNGAGLLFFTPDYTQSGSHKVTVIASDGDLSDSEQINITVAERNQPPSISPIGSQTVEEGQNLNFGVTASDPDGTIPTLTAEDVPDNASFIDHANGQGTLDFNPDYTQAGVYNVRFLASDGSLTDTIVVEVTVTNVNLPPTLNFITDKVVAQGQTVKHPLFPTSIF